MRFLCALLCSAHFFHFTKKGVFYIDRTELEEYYLDNIDIKALMDKDELDIIEARKRFDLAYKDETEFQNKNIVISIDKLLAIKDDVHAMELYWAFRKGYATAKSEAGDFSHI